MARHYEQEGNIGEAIMFYGKSNRTQHAIRLAKDGGYDQQVFAMSLTSTKNIMIQTAGYFEKKGKFDKAVQLFSRGGNKKRAMELAMKHRLQMAMEDLATGEGDDDDPEAMKNSVQFLLDNGQFDKAVEVMINLGDLDQALDLAET